MLRLCVVKPSPCLSVRPWGCVPSPSSSAGLCTPGWCSWGWAGAALGRWQSARLWGLLDLAVTLCVLLPMWSLLLLVIAAVTLGPVRGTPDRRMCPAGDTAHSRVSDTPLCPCSADWDLSWAQEQSEIKLYPPPCVCPAQGLIYLDD